MWCRNGWKKSSNYKGKEDEGKSLEIEEDPEEIFKQLEKYIFAKTNEEPDKEILKDFETEIKNSFSETKEIDIFSTWWSPYCALAINQMFSSFHYIYLVIYRRGQAFNVFRIGSPNTGSVYLSLNKIKEKKEEIKKTLDSDNPILANYDFTELQGFDIINGHCINDFNKLIDLTNFKREFDTDSFFDPKEHFKPLDVIWVKRSDKHSHLPYHHVGVYLGNNRLVNIATYYKKENSQRKKSKEARISSFQTFLKDSEKLIVYTPIIPSKRPSLILEQIRTIVETEYQRDNYSLSSRNCEHLSNILVYGVNKSHQVDRVVNSVAFSLEIAVKAAAMILEGSTQGASNSSTGFSLKKAIKQTNELLRELEKELQAKIEAPDLN